MAMISLLLVLLVTDGEVGQKCMVLGQHDVWHLIL
jgi:hypothetical protein